MAFQKSDKNIVLFKYGGTPTSANPVTLSTSPVLLQPNVATQDEKDAGTGKLGTTTTTVDGEHTTVQFDVVTALRGNDSTGIAPETPPEIADLFKACGLTEAVGVSDVTYTPNHDDITASQAIVYVDGYKRTVTGVRGNMKLSGRVGESAKVSSSLSGYTTPAATAEANPTVTLDGNDKLIINKITGFTVGGATINMQSFDLDLGNVIGDVYAVGLGEFERTDFDAKLTVEAIKTKGNEDAWSDFVDGTIREVIITIGSGAGNTVTITASQARTITAQESDDSGKLKISRTFRLQGDANGDNHYSIKYS